MSSRSAPFRVTIGLALAGLTSVPSLAVQQGPESGADAVRIEPGQRLSRSIRAEEVHTYTVDLTRETVLYVGVDQSGVNAAVAVYGPEGERLAAVDDVVSGPEELDVEVRRTGIHRIEVRPVWAGSDPRYELSVEARTRAEHRARMMERRTHADAAREWIRSHAIPLATVEAGNGFADLEPLRRVVGDARVVALGEATHGTREFFQLKHRMLEFLVDELGFDIFAIEASFPEALDVNHYVLTGEGDPARALAGMYFWTWDTEEVLELIRWMRNYNADPRHTRKVSFHGIDMQFLPRAARVVLEYLRRVDAAAAEAVEPTLSPLADPFLARHASSWPMERKRSLLASLRELAARFDARRDSYAVRTSAVEWDLVRRHVHVLQQAAEMRGSAGRAASIRDSAMAANLAWALKRRGPAAKAVLWAHNAHVSTRRGSTGWHLRRWLGEELRVFGFAFERGRFRARDVATDGTLRAFRVPPAPEGSLDGQLAAAGLTLAALDLRELPKSGPVAEWFGVPLHTRNIGSGYSERNPEWYWSSSPFTEDYDALFFVRETSVARGNPTGRRPTESLLAEPVNLDFEDGEPGDSPEGWTRPAGIAGVEWEAVLTRDGVRRGAKAVVFRRANARGYGETAAELWQRIDAAPWRGRRITLRASARVEPSEPASRAYLWLRVTRPAAAYSETVFYDYMADRPIEAPDWSEYEITADVPADADVIAYGFALVGKGRAWLDGVALESSGGQGRP